MTQGSGLRAGLLVGLRRAGQLIVEFWPSQRLFWAVWRFPQSSGATVRACQTPAFVLMPMQPLVSANFQVYLRGTVVVASGAGSLPSIGYGAPLQVACHSLAAGHAIPCFFPGGRRWSARAPRRPGLGTQRPREYGMARSASYIWNARASPRRRGEVHRVIGTGR